VVSGNERFTAEDEHVSVPVIRLEVRTGARLYLTRENAGLYTFAADVGLDVYNHVYTYDPLLPDGEQGHYIFAASCNFDRVAAYMIRNDYPALLNLREVPRGDLETYDRYITMLCRDAGDYVPQAWL
jgi:hypothetical protein